MLLFQPKNPGSGFLLCQRMTEASSPGMKYILAWEAAPNLFGFTKEPSSNEVP